jgi:hypothetical protein
MSSRVRLGDIAQLGDRSDIAVHRVHRFESDKFWSVGVEFGEPAIKV